MYAGSTVEDVELLLLCGVVGGRALKEVHDIHEAWVVLHAGG